MGLGPGHRHGDAPGVRRARGRAAARPADVDRQRPSRRALLLPARPGRDPRRRHGSHRGGPVDRACRDRRRRRHVVARSLDGRPRRRARRGPARRDLGDGGGQLHVHLEPEPPAARRVAGDRLRVACLDDTQPALVACCRCRPGGGPAGPSAGDRRVPGARSPVGRGSPAGSRSPGVDGPMGHGGPGADRAGVPAAPAP